MNASTSHLESGNALLPTEVATLLSAISGHLSLLVMKLSVPRQDGANANKEQDPFIRQLQALEPVLGPLCDSIEANDNGYALQMSHEQLKFLINFMRGSISALDKVVAVNQASLGTSMKAENLINELINPSGEDDLPTASEMMLTGQQEYLQERLQKSLLKRVVMTEYRANQVALQLMQQLGNSTLQVAAASELAQLIVKEGRFTLERAVPKEPQPQSNGSVVQFERRPATSLKTVG
ncbi:hypothetical protein ACYPKM_02655 [Pseudomonas aeruginosa]